MKYSQNADDNDMIHMGSDRTCVMATFVINADKRIVSAMITSTNRELIGKEDVDKEVSMFKERYLELEEEVKHGAAAEKIQSET